MSYMDLMNIFNEYCSNHKILLIDWDNGLSIKCKSFTGAYETDTELEESDVDYCGEYAATVRIVEVIEYPKKDSIVISLDSAMEISMLNLPSRIYSEDGITLWKM